MKRIGIDARLYFQTGVGVYIRNLLHYLEQKDTSEFIFYIYVMEEDAPNIHFQKENFIKREVSYKWHTVIEQLGFLGVLYKDKLDLMHFTYFSHPILYNRPFISTIHDVILLEHKTGKASTLSNPLYQFKHWVFSVVFFHQINKSRVIITPTDVVKKQILRIFGEKYQQKIITLHEGVDYKKMTLKANDSLAKQFSFPFFVYIGNFYPHKNIERLIEAYAKVKIDCKLLLIGPNDFFSDRIVEFVKQFQQEDRILLYRNASDEDIVFFYTHAKALIHPSLSEGFGLPLLEAAHFNLPVIASNIEVFKELLGGNYVAFNPQDISDIQEKIEEFIKNNKPFDYTSVLRAFSFEKMTTEILNIYKQLLIKK